MGRGRIARSDYKKKVGSRVPTRDPISSEKEHEIPSAPKKIGSRVPARDPIGTEKDGISRSSARSNQHRKRSQEKGLISGTKSEKDEIKK
jgi:hypothetical protein